MRDTEADTESIPEIDLSKIGKMWRPNRKQRRAMSKQAYKGHRNKFRAELAKQRRDMLSSVDGSEDTNAEREVQG
jgi:hypothetical protein